MKLRLTQFGTIFGSCLIAFSVHAQNLVQTQEFTWACSENHQLKTTGSGDSLGLNWNSKTYSMKKEPSLPGSLRYKNHDTGLDLVVLGNKAMLFNIKSGTRLADFCQTAEMKTGKFPHLFANAETVQPQ